MHPVVYLLLISLGAFLLLGIFHFVIYLQQNDKAFRNYAIYLFAMAGFNVLRLLDERLTDFYPLSYESIATFDPVLSNTAFLMYANFLGVLLNIGPGQPLFYRIWKGLQFFIPSFLLIYVLLRMVPGTGTTATLVINLASSVCIGVGLVMTLRLLQHYRDPFFQLVIAGTLTALIGLLAGFTINVFMLGDLFAFAGIYCMQSSQMIEAVFLSAALGYRLKLAFREKERAQQVLLEETRKREELATETARLLQQELSVREVQSRISRDLHDDVGASLSSLQIYSELAARLMEQQPGETRRLLHQISERVVGILEHMSHIVWAIQPADSDAQTIEARIRQISYDLLSPKNIYLDIELDAGALRHCNQPDIRRGLVLMVKEALNNTAKYSGATRVQIRLQRSGAELILTIADDGCGFDMEANRSGNGLRNIRLRAEKLQGTATIQAEPGKGTFITCIFPVPTISEGRTS